MKTLSTLGILFLLGACASTDPSQPGPRQSQLKDCPSGMVLICESQKRPTVEVAEEVPVYDRCFCEIGIN